MNELHFSWKKTQLSTKLKPKHDELVTQGRKVVGIPCLANSIKNWLPLPEYKEAPGRFRAIFSRAMEGLVIVTSNLSNDYRENLRVMVELSCGVFENHFTERTTHVVLKRPVGLKYAAAVANDVSIVTPKWVKQAFKVCRLPSESDYSVPCFAKLVFASTGFSPEIKAQIKSLVTSHGGIWSRDFVSNCNYLIVNFDNPKSSRKLKYAKTWKTFVTTEDWIRRCVRLAVCLPLDPLPELKTEEADKSYSHNIVHYTRSADTIPRRESTSNSTGNSCNDAGFTPRPKSRIMPSESSSSRDESTIRRAQSESDMEIRTGEDSEGKKSDFSIPDSASFLHIHPTPFPGLIKTGTDPVDLDSDSDTEESVQHGTEAEDSQHMKGTRQIQPETETSEIELLSQALHSLSPDSNKINPIDHFGTANNNNGTTEDDNNNDFVENSNQREPAAKSSSSLVLQNCSICRVGFGCVVAEKLRSVGVEVKRATQMMDAEYEELIAEIVNLGGKTTNDISSATHIVIQDPKLIKPEEKKAILNRQDAWVVNMEWLEDTLLFLIKQDEMRYTLKFLQGSWQAIKPSYLTSSCAVNSNPTPIQFPMSIPSIRSHGSGEESPSAPLQSCEPLKSVNNPRPFPVTSSAHPNPRNDLLNARTDTNEVRPAVLVPINQRIIQTPSLHTASHVLLQTAHHLQNLRQLDKKRALEIQKIEMARSKEMKHKSKAVVAQTTFKPTGIKKANAGRASDVPGTIKNVSRRYSEESIVVESDGEGFMPGGKSRKKIGLIFDPISTPTVALPYKSLTRRSSSHGSGEVDASKMELDEVIGSPFCSSYKYHWEDRTETAKKRKQPHSRDTKALDIILPTKKKKTTSEDNNNNDIQQQNGQEMQLNGENGKQFNGQETTLLQPESVPYSKSLLNPASVESPKCVNIEHMQDIGHGDHAQAENAVAKQSNLRVSQQQPQQQQQGLVGSDYHRAQDYVHDPAFAETQQTQTHFGDISMMVESSAPFFHAPSYQRPHHKDVNPVNNKNNGMADNRNVLNTRNVNYNNHGRKDEIPVNRFDELLPDEAFFMAGLAATPLHQPLQPLNQAHLADSRVNQQNNHQLHRMVPMESNNIPDQSQIIHEHIDDDTDAYNVTILQVEPAEGSKSGGESVILTLDRVDPHMKVVFGQVIAETIAHPTMAKLWATIPPSAVPLKVTLSILDQAGHRINNDSAQFVYK